MSSPACAKNAALMKYPRIKYLKGVGEDSEAEVADDESFARVGNMDGGGVPHGGLGVIESQVANLARE